MNVTRMTDEQIIALCKQSGAPDPASVKAHSVPINEISKEALERLFALQDKALNVMRDARFRSM